MRSRSACCVVCREILQPRFPVLPSFVGHESRQPTVFTHTCPRPDLRRHESLARIRDLRASAAGAGASLTSCAERESATSHAVATTRPLRTTHRGLAGIQSAAHGTTQGSRQSQGRETTGSTGRRLDTAPPNTCRQTDHESSIPRRDRQGCVSSNDPVLLR